MNLDQLKAEHPELYAALFALGKEAGSKEERDRVCAHLKLAEGSGDVDTAHKAIVSGDGITATVQAEHLSAAMKRQHRQDRAADNPPDVGASGGEFNSGDSAANASKEAREKAAYEAEHKGRVIE